MKKVTEVLPIYIFRLMKTVCGYIAIWGSPQRRGRRHCQSPWERLNDWSGKHYRKILFEILGAKIARYPFHIKSNHSGMMWGLSYLFFSYDERRRPRRGAPAADQWLPQKTPYPPCLGEALRRSPSYIVRFLMFGCVLPFMPVSTKQK